MPKLTAANVARVTGGRAMGPDATSTCLVADSREVTPGVAFAAIAGGHVFIDAAFAAGAPFVVTERRDTDDTGRTLVIVDDIERALAAVAADVREDLDTPVVGITGSTGKTLTKDFVAAALGSALRVHATPRSYNAEIGVPLTLLRTPEGTQAVVIEMGARHAGEIAELCAIARPTTGIITGIGVSHVDEFGSRDAIARAKSELLTALPADGTAFVPSDDEYLDVLVSSTSARVMTVGPGGSVRYRAERIDTGGRTYGTVTLGSRRVPVTIPVPGRALLRNAALAMAVAWFFDIDPPAAAAAIADTQMSSWRMQVVSIGGRTVVNDAWNANPTSVAAALRSTRELAASRPVWAVLGRMAELGPITETEHLRAGALAAALGYDGVIAVGAEASAIGDGAGSIAMRVGSLAEAVDAIHRVVPSDAVVVVKASRVAGLERLVDEITSVTNEKVT